MTSTAILSIYLCMDKKIFFNTTVSQALIKKFKILAIKLDKRQNALFEEAIQDILDKYKSQEDE